MQNDKALVLLSGGQDSSTCLFWALERFNGVWSIGFDYKQRHRIELEAGRDIALLANVPYKIIEIDMLSSYSVNALTNIEIEVEDDIRKDRPPNTLVEGRNLLFLTYAAIYAKQKDITNLVIGVGQTDYSGYPDCRNEFIRSANSTINLALGYNLIIHTPLMWKTKAQVWAMTDELGVFDLIMKQTVTCYNGIIADGCGKCPACKLRKAGLVEYLRVNNK